MRNPVAPVTILVLTLALIGIGIVMVYSASGARAGWEQRRIVQSIDAEVVDEYSHHSPLYLERQLLWVGVSLAWLMLLVGMDTRWLYRSAPYVAAAVLALLFLVIATPMGVTSKGATRWLRLGPLAIQPSEFAKPALVLLMARLLETKREKARHLLKGFLPLAATTGIFLGLILAGRDLGTVLVLGTVVFAMWCLARLRAAHLAGIVVIAIPGLVFALMSHSYRLARIWAFFEPEKFALTTGYQLNQSLIAVGSGGLIGRGFGEGMQQTHFVPFPYSDFIGSTLGEEWGFIGIAGITIAFAMYALFGFRIARQARTPFLQLVAVGLTFTTVLTAFLHLGVVIGLLPTTGLTLPFVSFGRSNLVLTMLFTGILVNIGSARERVIGSTATNPLAAAA